MSCPFCSPPSTLFEDELVLALWAPAPVAPGHALLVTRRHLATWWEATPEEQSALWAATHRLRSLLETRHQPAGYKLECEASGHLHLHVIPRYDREVPTFVRGEHDPLYLHLRQALETARRVDMAVAFLQKSGWRKLEGHLRDVLAREGSVRLLTGDYCEMTDPDALEEVMLFQQERDRFEARIYETRQGESFHPKAYIIGSDGGTQAFVGSSNLSGPALGEGIEWNYRAVSSRDPRGVEQLRQAFEDLFQRPQSLPLEQDWIDRYRSRRAPSFVSDVRQRGDDPPFAVRIAEDPPEPPPLPHGVQMEALAALERTRQLGNRSGLVVMATGLGKTWLGAFDACRAEFPRVLFVAHRDEILTQAMATFRRVQPHRSYGYYKGQQRDLRADMLFASIQTLGRTAHLERFPSDHFDYIVVDEFHHASAATYRRLLARFTPTFMLGLTATPDRSDGGDLLSLCGENLVYDCGLVQGIRRELLCTFDYFGVPDAVDYENIRWRGNRFDPDELTRAVATQARARNALEQYRARGGRRTLGFCCSVLHAQFMAEFFRAEAGLRTAAVHSGPDSDPRQSSLEKLERGELDVIFSVDMFNEGLDLPAVDTVMMLRPTESRILWLQQFGRGLRRHADKSHLRVIDYIGNHRAFLIKPQTLFNLPAGDDHVARILKAARSACLELPPGCHVTYDLEALEILEKLLRLGRKDEALRLAYEDLGQRLGERPTAVQMHHEGYNPRSVRKRYGSWFGFVQAMGDLPDIPAPALLDELETTAMQKSYQMVLLQALLDLDALPGRVAVDDLTRAFARIASRSAQLRADVTVPLDSLPQLRALLIKQPIAALTGQWTDVSGSCHFDGSYFETRFPAESTPLVRELVEFRLAEYLQRRPDGNPAPSRAQDMCGGGKTQTKKPYANQ